MGLAIEVGYYVQKNVALVEVCWCPKKSKTSELRLLENIHKTQLRELARLNWLQYYTCVVGKLNLVQYSTLAQTKTSFIVENN